MKDEFIDESEALEDFYLEFIRALTENENLTKLTIESKPSMPIVEQIFNTLATKMT